MVVSVGTTWSVSHSTGGSPSLSLMPLAYVINVDQRLVVITGDTRTPANGRTCWVACWRMRRQPGFGFLRDLRGATAPVDAATVVRLMAVVRRFWPHLQPSRAAIVTPFHADAAALVALAVADTEVLPFRLFSSYDEAIEWLRQVTSDATRAAAE